MATEKVRVGKQALQGRLILSSIQETLDRVASFGIEDRPNSDGTVIPMTEPDQKPIDGRGFRLEPFESVAINPAQVSVLHVFVRTTIFGGTQEAD